MKKLFALLLAVFMLLSLAACSQGESEKETEAADDHSGHSHSHANLEPSEGNSEHLLSEYEALVNRYVEQKKQNPNGAEIIFQQILDTQHELETYAGKVKEKMGEEAYLEFLNQANAINETLYDNM